MVVRPSSQFTSVVAGLPASVPFVGPETLERQRGEVFRARIGANESAFGISPVAAQAMIEAIAQRGCSWYGDPESYVLRSQLADMHSVAMDEICVDSGIDTLLGLSVRMLVESGTPVVTSLGAYPTFNYHVNGYGGNLSTVPYRNNHEDSEALITAAHELSAKMVYLSNPDNPMGTCLKSKTVALMIRQLPENCVMILDEAYVEFAADNVAPPIDTNNPQLIRMRTFSKAYGLAGMRIGYAIAHRELIGGLNRIRNHFGINRLAQIAASASLTDAEMLPNVTKQVVTGRQRIYQLASTLSLDYLNSSTNFVAVNLGSNDRATEILKSLNNAGVFIRMPNVSPLNNYIRVGIGTKAEHAVFAEEFSRVVT